MMKERLKYLIIGAGGYRGLHCRVFKGIGEGCDVDCEGKGVGDDSEERPANSERG